LETNTVRPSAASALNRLRIQTMPSGSRPLTGSSNMRMAGAPSSAAAIPRRWLMPSRERAHPLAGHRVHADELEHLADGAAGDAVALGEAPQVLAGAAPAVDGLGVEERAH